MNNNKTAMLAAAFTATLSATAPNMAQADNSAEMSNSNDYATLTTESTQEEINILDDKVQTSLTMSKDFHLSDYLDENVGELTEDIREKYSAETESLNESLNKVENITERQVETALTIEACNYITDKDLKELANNEQPLAEMAKGNLEKLKDNCKDAAMLEYIVVDASIDIEEDRSKGVPMKGMRGGQYYPPKADFMQNAAQEVVNSVTDGCESMSSEERLNQSIHNSNKIAREVISSEEALQTLDSTQIKERLEIAQNLIGTYDISPEGVKVTFGATSKHNVSMVELDNAQQEVAKNPSSEKSQCQDIGYDVGMI